MPAACLRQLLDDALADGRAVPAFNVVDELSMDAVLAGAARARSPVVVQVSVRTAKYWGREPLAAAFETRSRLHSTTAVLHLDHCTDPLFLLACLDSGWTSALIDTSHLPYAESVRTTRGVVRTAAAYDAVIEGEFERIPRLDDSGDSGEQGASSSLDDEVAFLEATGVHCLGPALGTRHGMHIDEPEIDHDRARRLSALTRVVLHGGSGLSEGCLRKVVASGVTKINFSSVLKQTYVSAVRDFAGTTGTEPLDWMSTAHTRIGELCGHYARVTGSAGACR